MFRRSGWSVIAAGALFGCDSSPNAQGASVAPAQVAGERTGDSSEQTVLVELFTSEGCSSCPPADALLADLLADDSLDVLAVAYHVDYWDDLGWKDTFSDARWSARQYAYAEAFGTNRVYTPQLLFNGRDHHIGRSESGARSAIESSAGANGVRLDPRAEQAGKRVSVTIDIEGTATLGDEPTQLLVALVEHDRKTDVPRGENAGRTLHHEAIALDLAHACDLGPATSQCSASLNARAAHDGSALEVVAFVQGERDMVVHQAARAPL